MRERLRRAADPHEELAPRLSKRQLFSLSLSSISLTKVNVPVYQQIQTLRVTSAWVFSCCAWRPQLSFPDVTTRGQSKIALCRFQSCLIGHELNSGHLSALFSSGRIVWFHAGFCVYLHCSFFRYILSLISRHDIKDKARHMLRLLITLYRNIK